VCSVGRRPAARGPRFPGCVPFNDSNIGQRVAPYAFHDAAVVKPEGDLINTYYICGKS
jgi:hypothetical protein